MFETRMFTSSESVSKDLDSVTFSIVKSVIRGQNFQNVLVTSQGLIDIQFFK